MKAFVVGVLSALAFSLFSIGFAGGARAGETQTLDAFAAWQGRGQLFAVGENEAMFVGSFLGVVYLDGKEGPLDAGYIVCPGVFQIEMSTEKQVGRGRCTFTDDEGARAYTSWECQGTHQKGCQGSMTFTGGSGRLSGISGGGPMTVRSKLHVMANEIPGNSVQEFAAGIVVWKGLKVELP